MASDGRWYPPETHPNYVPPPPAPISSQYPSTGYQEVPASRGTNGLAIASLVLSLIWLGGLGSLLAVIFGVIAKRQIKSTGQSGSGLATAGLVIGIIGIVGSVVLYSSVVLIAHKVDQALNPHVVQMGQTIDSPIESTDGIATVTVYSLSYPVQAAPQFAGATGGNELAAADVQVCAGPSGSTGGITAAFLDLVLQSGPDASSSLVPTKTPQFPIGQSLAANRCARGFMTFEMQPGAVPSYVLYWPTPFQKYQWTVTAG